MFFSKKTLALILLSVSVLAAWLTAQDTDVIKLPAPQMTGGKPLLDCLKARQSGREFDVEKLSTQVLSNLLWAADGINRPDSGKRTAPSAVNWQDIDIFAATADGLFLYLPKEHALRKILGEDVRAAMGKPIASLFELPRRTAGKLGNVKTEIMFIERCLSLLRPGGRMAIVLPEGIFNNPSQAYVRRFCEDRAFIRAVVSLPQDTFVSSGASVKASLLFMQKYTEDEKADYERKRADAEREIRATKIETETALLRMKTEAAKDAAKREDAVAAMKRYQRSMEDRIEAEVRASLKERFPYPVFLYEAEHVGITATGEPDATELYEDPTLGLPPGITADTTALALYRAFRADPKAFLRGQA